MWTGTGPPTRTDRPTHSSAGHPRDPSTPSRGVRWDETSTPHTSEPQSDTGWGRVCGSTEQGNVELDVRRTGVCTHGSLGPSPSPVVSGHTPGCNHVWNDGTTGRRDRNTRGRVSTDRGGDGTGPTGRERSEKSGKGTDTTSVEGTGE